MKKDSFKFLAGATMGYSLFWLFSNPRSKVKNRLPTKKIRNISLLPNIKLQRRDTQYHLHHWMNLMFLYGLVHLKKRGFLRSKVVTGFLVGGILQGLSYSDRFTIRQKLEQIQDAN